jgi:predicted transcriptional regulator
MVEPREALLLRLPPKLKAEVCELARMHKRSATKEIEIAIEEYVGAASPSPAERASA